MSVAHFSITLSSASGSFAPGGNGCGVHRTYVALVSPLELPNLHLGFGNSASRPLNGPPLTKALVPPIL